MHEVVYVKDPSDSVGIRCFHSPDGVTFCKRRRDHPTNTMVIKEIDHPSGEKLKVEFNHRGQKDGIWVTW